MNPSASSTSTSPSCIPLLCRNVHAAAPRRALVSVDEGMIACERLKKRGSLGELVGVSVNAEDRGPRSGDSRVQQTVVTDRQNTPERGGTPRPRNRHSPFDFHRTHHHPRRSRNVTNQQAEADIDFSSLPQVHQTARRPSYRLSASRKSPPQLPRKSSRAPLGWT
jgi:hypothetical protein